MDALDVVRYKGTTLAVERVSINVIYHRQLWPQAKYFDKLKTCGTGWWWSGLCYRFWMLNSLVWELSGTVMHDTLSLDALTVPFWCVKCSSEQSRALHLNLLRKLCLSKCAARYRDYISILFHNKFEVSQKLDNEAEGVGDHYFHRLVEASSARRTQPTLCCKRGEQ